MSDGEVTVEPSRKPRSIDSALTEIVRRRGVRRVAYFHCDHFEPWRPAPGSRTLQENAADVIRFAETSARNDVSRRLTLFYKAHLPVSRDVSSPLVTALSTDDVFGFAHRTAEQEEIFAGAMQGLLERVRHEVQVHIHHEYYTYNSSHKNAEVIELFKKPEMRTRDSARFELGLRLSLDAIRRETGCDLLPWFFVHGMWALNGSDPEVCHITDEIEILLRHGCLGDFTFPAGRPNVDPVQEKPHFVRPWNARQGYVLPQAEPELAFGNTEASRSKFFIWASDIRHSGSSIDYFSALGRQKLEDTRGFAREVLERSYVADGTLYFKTHAHSMHALYRNEDKPLIFPHQHPAVATVLGRVFDAAIATGASVDFLTASEIYEEFIKTRAAPPEGFALPAPFNRMAAAALKPLLESGRKSPVLHVDEVNAASTSVLVEALKREGLMAPGIGEYYRRRAERGEVLPLYEVRIAQALLQEGPFETVYEIGSGVSALPLLLALNGVKSVGIERDTPRADLGRLIAERLAEDFPQLARFCTIRRAAAPEALRDVDGEKCAVVFTNITSAISDGELDELIRRVALFRTLVVDLSRFFEVRDDKAEQAALLERFVAAGCANPVPLANPRDNYWMFRNQTDFDERND